MLEGVSEDPIHTALSDDTQRAINESLAHADDLLVAARRIVDETPHLAYHFAVLALEEVGRSDLLAMVEIAKVEGDESSGLERALEDHVAKLFWAVWGPSFGREVITRAQIGQYRDIARDLHEKRKAGLYYDPDAPPPRESISHSEAGSVIDLAAARIGLERSHTWGPLDEARAQDVRWLVERMRDRQARRELMSRASMRKLVELGDAPAWVAWFRSEADKAEKESVELAQRELARPAPKGADAHEPKWQLKVRLVSSSHSIREKPLNWWNTRVERIKLHAAGAEHRELSVEITLPKQVAAAALWHVGLNLTTDLVVALNIGTNGFFWWYTPVHVSRFYDEIIDIEQGAGIVVERSPQLRLDWGRLVLSEIELGRVALCLGAIRRLESAEVREALGHYHRALALLAKNDLFLRFEINAFEEFYVSLRTAMRAFGRWDGASPYVPIFVEHVRAFATYSEDAERYTALAERIEARQMENAQLDLADVGKMKLLVDAFFFWAFDGMRRSFAQAPTSARANNDSPQGSDPTP